MTDFNRALVQLFAITVPFLLGCQIPSTEPLTGPEFYAPLGSAFSNISREEAQLNVDKLTASLEESLSNERVVILKERGLWYRALGNFDAAMGDLDQACKIAPENWSPLFHRWQLNLHIGNAERAAIDRKRGLELKPDVFLRDYSLEGGII